MTGSRILPVVALVVAVGFSSAAQQKQWDPFLDTLEARTINWFLTATPKATGLTPDRWPHQSPSSVAAVGFCLSVYPIAAERHIISRNDAAQRVLQTLRFLYHAPQNDSRSGVIGYRGFFYHFVAQADGSREWRSELSTVDTALLMAGVLFCQSYFNRSAVAEREIRSLADSLYRRVDWTWSAEGRPGIVLGWTPESGFDEVSWHGYCEAMIMYILGLGSPTHPVQPRVWDYWTSTYVWAQYYGREFISFGPLFGHQFSHCWIDFRGIQDAYMRSKGIDYFENSRRATLSQQSYAADNPKEFRGYSDRIWGISPCDGPKDTTCIIEGRARRFFTYAGRGVSFDWSLDDGTIAPTAAGGSLPFAPEPCLTALKAMRAAYGTRVWNDYGFVDALNPTYVASPSGDAGWFDADQLGIDQGPIVLMIENYRTGLVWKTMRKNPYIIAGLRQAGFSGGWLDAQR